MATVNKCVLLFGVSVQIAEKHNLSYLLQMLNEHFQVIDLAVIVFGRVLPLSV